mmetsp:Transcript_160974/g.283702  ORF Transcript_160974/g.283702 Transcript_160974/m.283702 type:complete len:1127 (+) Transcript_160974:31-3411(+)
MALGGADPLLSQHDTTAPSSFSTSCIRPSSSMDADSLQDPGLRALSRGSASQSDNLQRRMQEIVDDELMHERARQINDLNSKVLDLEADRAQAADELETTQRQYQFLVEDARAQLEQVQAEQARMQSESTRLGQLLDEAKRNHSVTREHQEQEMAAQTGKMEAEVRRLLELRSSTESRVEATHSEIQEFRQMLEILYTKRARAQEESGSVANAVQALSESLHHAKQQLEETEQQRAVLRDRYLNVGRRFEEAVGASEKESQVLLADLHEELKRNTKRLDKYKQRYSKAEAELCSLEATCNSQKKALEDKGSEITRLQQALESERVSHSRRETQYLQCQQQQLQDQNPQLQHLSDMIAIGTHQKLLEDQAKHYRERLRDLERRLRSEVPPGSPGFGSDHNDRRHRYMQGARPTGPSGRACRVDGFHQAEVREEVRHMEAEMREVRQRHRKVEAAASKSEEERRALASSVAEAQSHISRLQRIVNDESLASEEAQAEAAEAKSEADLASTEMASRTATLRIVREEASESERLSVTVRDQGWKISALEESLERQRAECHSRELEFSVAKGEHQTFAARLESSDKQASQLRAQKARDQARYRRQCDVFRHIQELLRAHVREAKADLQHLRGDVQSTLAQVWQRCESQTRECVSALQTQKWNVSVKGSALERAAEDAEVRNKELEARLECSLQENAHHERQLEELVQEEALQKAAQANAEEVLSSHRNNMERVLHTMVLTLLGGRGWEAVKARMLGERTFCNPSFAELLPRFHEELDASLQSACTVAVQAQRGELLTQVEADARREAASRVLTQATHHSEAMAEVRQAAALCDRLRAENSRRAAEREARLQERMAECTQLDSEVADFEGKLQIARQEIQEREAEVAALTQRLQSLRIQASVDVEVSTTEAVDPLKKQLRQLLTDVEELQQRYAREWEGAERTWASRCARAVEAHREHMADLEQQFEREADELRSEMDAARRSEHEAAEYMERRASELSEQLRNNQGSLEDKRSACKAFKSECDISQQDELHSRSMLENAERHLAEVQQASRRELDQSELMQAQAAQQRERALDELRRKKEAEVATVQSLLNQSFSTLAGALDDSVDVGQAHPGKSAERLTESARRLGIPST